MTSRQRQFALLAVLAVTLAVVLTKVMGEPAETSQPPSNRVTRGTSSKDAVIPVVDVGLDRLKVERGDLEPAERNPFRFRPKPAPPPPPPVAREVVRPTQPVAPAVPAGPPPPAPIALKFIGFLDASGPGSRVGIFSDGRGGPMQAKEGDILEGRYRVLRIGTDSADLVYLDGRGRQTIPLRGQ
jgi:type IV secretory pathway VirB10-like protein